jgi:hypothetical protein
MESEMRMRGRIEVGGALLASVLSSGCTQLERVSAEGEPDGLPASVQAALTRACATDGICHVPGTTNIVVLAGTSLSALEDGGYVRRGDLEGSLLAVKMLSLPGIVNSPMPPPTHPADPDDLALILAWIAGLDPVDAGASSSSGASGADAASSDDAATTGEPVDCLQGQPLGSPPAFSELWPMLEATCSVSTACHLQDEAPLMPDEATAYTNMVNMTNSAGLTFVTPGSPDDSYVWHKLAGTHLEVGGAGGRMPMGPPLCDAGLVGVYAWILGGANE